MRDRALSHLGHLQPVEMGDGDENDVGDVEGNKSYMSKGALAVVNFKSYRKRAVQSVVTECPPIEVILKYHRVVIIAHQSKGKREKGTKKV